MAVMYATGIIHNSSDSMPTGFYRRVNRPPRVGDLVMLEWPENPHTRVKPPDKHLIKKIVAGAGMGVRIGKDGIKVNGIPLNKSTPLDVLPSATVDKTLEPGEIIVASDYNVLSYDSRYFGIIKADTIQCVVEPIFTWGAPDEAFEGKENQ